MDTYEMALPEFIDAIEDFLHLHNGRPMPLVLHEECCYFPDPPGSVFLASYLEQRAQQPKNATFSLVHWDIPPAPLAPRQQDEIGYIARAFLSQMGDSPPPRLRSQTLHERLKNTFKQDPPDLVVITGWDNLVATEQGTVLIFQVHYVKGLLHTILPHTYALAIGAPDVMKPIFASDVQLNHMFQMLLLAHSQRYMDIVRERLEESHGER